MSQLIVRKKASNRFAFICCSVVLLFLSVCSRKNNHAVFPRANIGQWLSDANIELKFELSRPDAAWLHVKNKTDSALTIDMIRLLSVKNKKCKVLSKIYGCKEEGGRYKLHYDFNTTEESSSLSDMNNHPLLSHRDIIIEMEGDQDSDEPLLVLSPNEKKEVPILPGILTAQWSFSGVSEPLQNVLSSIQIDILSSDNRWFGPFEIFFTEEFSTPGIEVYRHLTSYDTKEQFSNDIKIIENPGNEIVIMTLHSKSKVVYWCKYSGVRVQGNCDNCIFANRGATMDVYDLFLGVNSRNVSIDINPEVGYTTVVGLKIQDPVIIKNIWQDGTIELNKKNVRAVDFEGNAWLSKKIKVNGKKTIVFAKI